MGGEVAKGGGKIGGRGGHKSGSKSSGNNHECRGAL